MSVFVSRGGARPTRFATFSGPLGSPIGTTISGQFRFTCKIADAPCKVSFGAAVISQRSGRATLFSRLLLHKDVGGGGPISFCEYADGANNNLGVDRIQRVPTLRAAVSATRVPQNMGIGGSLDCGVTGQPYTPSVKEIWVPSLGNDSAFYDVWVTSTIR